MVQLGQPLNDEFEPSFKLLKKYDHPEFEGECYLQANRSSTFQRVFLVFPKNLSGRVPDVEVLQASGYRPDDGRLVIYNHASGHRPPDDVLNKTDIIFLISG